VSPRAAPTPDEIASLLQVEHLLDQRWPETKIEPSLTRINALMELLGSPQRGYPSIHIAGTNGKTSVARIVDALLTALGRRTGRTTSPHLQSAVERIAIDDREHQLDLGAGILGGLDRLHGRVAGGGDVVEDHDAHSFQVALLHALDPLHGAVILHGLAHEKSRDRAALRIAQHCDLRQQRHGPHRQPADIMHLDAFELVENQLRQQACPFGVEHRRLHVEVVIARPPGYEHERSARERQSLDDVEHFFAQSKRVARRLRQGHGSLRICRLAQAIADHCENESCRH